MFRSRRLFDLIAAPLVGRDAIAGNPSELWLRSDEIVCVATPQNLGSVGQFYQIRAATRGD